MELVGSCRHFRSDVCKWKDCRRISSKPAPWGHMALIGLVNLAERLFNQTQRNPNEDSGLTTKTPKGDATQATQLKPSDEFRPSSGNAANEAGLFQVSQASVFTT